MTQSRAEWPKDSEKQGYKFLLDSLRDQLLKPKQAEMPQSVPVQPWTQLPAGKKHFRTQEVARLLDISSQTVRLWEKELKTIRPKKTRHGQRIYERRDVEKFAALHHLIHTQKYTLDGAKQQLLNPSPQAPPPADLALLRSLVHDLRRLVVAIEQTPL